MTPKEPHPQGDNPEAGTKKPNIERVAYTVTEFCAAYRCSRTHMYKLWKSGLGPRRRYMGRRFIITVEDAVAWQRNTV
jgi:hypothetical protein